MLYRYNHWIIWCYYIQLISYFTDESNAVVHGVSFIIHVIQTSSTMKQESMESFIIADGFLQVKTQQRQQWNIVWYLKKRQTYIILKFESG